MLTAISETFGALLIGGLIAAVFTGIVTVQVFVYFRFYPSDTAALKFLVAVVWTIDGLHMICISMALWDHLIQHFGDAAIIDFIPWSLALTIAFTAVLTFLVHCFYVHRIFKLSRNNFFIATPLAVIACLRLGFACLTTIKMIELKSLEAFIKGYTWSFTLGLALSSLLDILVTGLLCFFLMIGRRNNSNASIHHLLDSLMLYAFENGSLTCTATVISMICWLAMPGNLIFMALHFIISKFYANSLLATLNTRRGLTDNYGSSSNSNGDRGLPLYSSDLRRISRNNTFYSKRGSRLEETKPVPGHVRIKVESMILQTVDSGSDTLPAPPSPAACKSDVNSSQISDL